MQIYIILIIVVCFSLSASISGFLFIQNSGSSSSPPAIIRKQITRMDNINKCIDIEQNKTDNGTKIQMYDCNPGDAQLFTYIPSTQQLKSANGKCLDVDGGNVNNGTKIQLWECDDNNQNQKWKYDDQSIKWAPHNNKCIDANGGSLDNGTKMQIWDCNGGNAQHYNWSF